MKHLSYQFTAIFAVLFCLSQAALAQGVESRPSIQTGFAVVTPLLGGGQGLSVSQNLSHRVERNIFQATVPSSPFVTFSTLVVRVDANAGANTGIAIVNSSVTPATITLTLQNREGSGVAIRTITIGGQQQLSRFVTQLFLGVHELESPFAGLLLIRSRAPFGVMGLDFQGLSFTASVIAAPGSGPIVLTPSDAVSFTPGFLLPQVVSGGGWSSRIVITNRSTVKQLVRVIFFDSAGSPLVVPIAANPPISVPAGGVVTVPAGN